VSGAPPTVGFDGDDTPEGLTSDHLPSYGRRMLTYGFEVNDPVRYGVAVEVALDELRAAAADERELTRLRRAAEEVGATRTEIAAAITEARAGLLH